MPASMDRARRRRIQKCSVMRGRKSSITGRLRRLAATPRARSTPSCTPLATRLPDAGRVLANATSPEVPAEAEDPQQGEQATEDRGQADYDNPARDVFSGLSPGRRPHLTAAFPGRAIAASCPPNPPLATRWCISPRRSYHTTPTLQ